MKRFKFLIFLGIFFILLSGLLHYVHFLIFGDVHHIFIYLLGDLAFLPLEVFIVVIVIERVLADREQRSMLNKLNMVIGAFFSEVGNYLLKKLPKCFENYEEICAKFNVDQNWTHKKFLDTIAMAASITAVPHFQVTDLVQLKQFLLEKRIFLLRLLENPNILEHERFTDLLWATFHLTEELEARESLEDMPPSDLNHICGDIQRVYNNLLAEWLDYLEHIKNKYPYLFSLVARTHPFQPKPSPIVK